MAGTSSACPLRRETHTQLGVVIQATGLQPGAREHILRNRLSLEPALILALTNIRPRAEVLACQKQAQSSH
jgi:hypothetical protein